MPLQEEITEGFNAKQAMVAFSLGKKKITVWSQFSCTNTKNVVLNCSLSLKKMLVANMCVQLCFSYLKVGRVWKSNNVATRSV